LKLSHDSSSWHASGLIARDERHTKTEQQVARHGAKKNTKRWCRGRVGKEHKTEWRNWQALREHREDRPQDGHFFVLICTTCKREVDTCFAWVGGRCKNKNHSHYVAK